MPNAFISANKLRRYGPIITHCQANLKPRQNTDIVSRCLVYADKASYTSRSDHMIFPGFRHCSNGSAHEISCQAALRRFAGGVT